MNETALEWTPNARFAEDAARFAELRTTDQYREEEVDYKKAYAAVLRNVLSPESRHSPGFSMRISDLLNGKLDLAGQELSDQEREWLASWPYPSTLINLMGNSQAAAIQGGSFAAWAARYGDTRVADFFDQLLDAQVPVGVRVDRAQADLTNAYKTLHEAGQLKAKDVPHPQMNFLAILLGLFQPAEYVFYRPDMWTNAANEFDYPPPIGDTAGERYLAGIQMLNAFRAALVQSGQSIDDLLEVHNFLWVRSKGELWTDYKWTPEDFEAMRTDRTQDRAAVGRVGDRVKWVGERLRDELHRRGHTRLRVSLLGLNFPTDKSRWGWLTASLTEAPAQSPHTAYPQLNVEARASGIDVFFHFDWQRATTLPVLARPVAGLESLRANRTLVSSIEGAGYTEIADDRPYMLRRGFPIETVVGWANFGIAELADQLEVLLPAYDVVMAGDAAATPPHVKGVHEGRPDYVAGRNYADILRAGIAARGLVVDDDTMDSIYLSLRTKPFLLLTGLSGTGKTKIALALQDLLCGPDTRAFVSVRPDWTDSRGLLGFHNVLSDEYQTTPVLRLLMAADREWTARGAASRPYILLLDEMNLARVEYYFSDFLSALESRRVVSDEFESEPIALHDVSAGLVAAGAIDGDPRVPREILVPRNLYVVGTVNVDETTHPFSKKVLDRANTIELFDVDLRGTSVAAISPDEAQADDLRRHFSRNGMFIQLTAPSLATPWLDKLILVNQALERHRLHFGYRVRDEVLEYLTQAGQEGFLGTGDGARRKAFDLQLMQKVLPRLSGSRERLERPLRALLTLAIGAPHGAGIVATVSDRYEELYRRLSAPEPQPTALLEQVAVAEVEANREVGPSDPLDETISAKANATLADLDVTGISYPRSARKIARMLLQLHEEGYSSFFE